MLLRIKKAGIAYLLVLGGLNGIVPAQTTAPADTANVPRPNFLSRFKYRAAFNGSATTGNAERLVLAAACSLAYADSVIDWNLAPSFAYGEVATLADEQRVQQVQERELGLNGNFGLFSRAMFYGFALGAAERSNLRAIDLRWTGGIGAGWHIVRSEKHRLLFSLAILQESTNFVNPATPDYQVQRGSFRLKGRHRFLNNHLMISHLTNYLPDIQFDENTRLNTEWTIEIPFSTKVRFTAGFLYTHESIVPAGKRPDDTRTTVGLVFTNF